MIDPNNGPSSGNSGQAVDPLFVPKIIWGALLGSNVIYFGLAAMKSQSYEFSEMIPADPMHLVLAFMALVSLAASAVVPKIIAKNNAKNMKPESPLGTLLPAFFAPFIIRLAMLESCTLYGFVIALTRHQVMPMVPFAMVAVIGYLMAFPSEANVRAFFFGAKGPEVI